MSFEEDVRNLVERQAIIDLLHHMCYLIDSFQIDRLVDEVYAPDGSDDHGGGAVVGRDALHAWYTDSTRNVAAIAHNIANIIVDVEGDKATARSNVVTLTWTMENVDKGPKRNIDYALSLTYHDRFTKYPQGWRVDERVLVPNVSKTSDSYVIALGELPATQRGIQALSKKAPPQAA